MGSIAGRGQDGPGQLGDVRRVTSVRLCINQMVSVIPRPIGAKDNSLHSLLFRFSKTCNAARSLSVARFKLHLNVPLPNLR